jgi:hypothetical protein
MAQNDLELTPVYIAYGHMQAEIIRAKLEAAGIPALLQYESAGLILGVTVDGLGQVKVMVRARDADDARALLEPPADLAASAAEEDESRPAGPQ